MATTPPVIQEQAPKAKVPTIPLMVAVILGVFASVSAVGGIGYFLIHSGKLRLQTMPMKTVQQEPETTHTVLLEPLVVNLADVSGAAYLRVSIALSVVDKAKAEGGASEKGADAAVRDTALEVLGRETSEGLLAVDGKDRAKRALKEAIAQRLPETKIADLYFTEFLVQR